MPSLMLSLLAVAVWSSLCGGGAQAQAQAQAQREAPLEVATTSVAPGETPTPSLITDHPVTLPPASVALEIWLKDHVSENETDLDLACDEVRRGSVQGAEDGPGNGSIVRSAVLQSDTLDSYASVAHLSITGCEYVILEESSVPAHVETVTLTLIRNLGFRQGWHRQATRLRTLNITLNQLQSIKVCDIPSLVSVDVSDNHLAVVDLASCGKRLEALVSLRVAYNELETLLLCSSPNLESLDVSRNRLTDITEAYAGCLHDASKLKVLVMAGNNITAFSSCSFPALETLDISSNGLVHLDLATCSTHNLHTLLLTHNSLSDVLVPKSVRTLDLSHNLLEEMFHLPRNLIEADLSHNKLKKLGKDRFRRSRKLLHLNLAFNQLTRITDGELVGLSHVQDLDMRHNHLLQLDSFALAPLNKLRNLRMQHNQLTYVHARTFDFLPEDARVHLVDNPWMCSCQLLAHLQATVRRHCRSKCKSEVTLYCEERRERHLASDILRKCLHTVAQINRDRQLLQGNASESSPHPQHEQEHGGGGGDHHHHHHQYPSVLTPHLQPVFDPDQDPFYDPESDEDQSEEMSNLDAASASSSENEETHYVLAVPAVVVLVICVVVGVLVHRMYKKRRHLGTLCSTCPFFGAGAFVPAQKVPTSNGDSDSETEL